MIEAGCSCCGEHTELPHDADHVLHERMYARCSECGAIGKLIAHESDDGWSVERFELVVPRSEVERLAAEYRRDRRNHREMVQVMALHLIDPMTIPLGDDSFGRGVALSTRLLHIRHAWQMSINARQNSLLGGGATWERERRQYRQRARDLSRHLRRLFATAPELEREALEHVLAAARRL